MESPVQMSPSDMTVEVFGYVNNKESTAVALSRRAGPLGDGGAEK